MTGGAALSHNNTSNLIIWNRSNNRRLYLITTEDYHPVANFWLLDAKNLARNTLTYIQYIRCTLTKILVVHRLENLGRLSSRCQNSCWCIPHLLNLISHAVCQHRVLCQEQMSLHNIGLLIMTYGTHLLNALFQNICHLGYSTIELLQLLFHCTWLIRSQIAIQCLTSLHNIADSYSWNGTHSLHFFWHNISVLPPFY